MNPNGQLTSNVAKYIKDKLNAEGYDVYSDHGEAGEFIGTIAVSINDTLRQKEEISQLDIAVVEENPKGEEKLRRAIALIEIEETTDNPKKLIGDIFTLLMGKSIYLPGGEEVVAGEWTTLIIIAKDVDHEHRNKEIQNMANDARFAFGTANLKIGNIIIDSFSVDKRLENVLMNNIEKAINRK